MDFVEGEGIGDGVDGGRVFEELVEIGHVPVIGVLGAEGQGEGEADIDGGAGLGIGEDDAGAAAEFFGEDGGLGFELGGFEGDAGELELVEGIGEEVGLIDVGGADEFEGDIGASADGDVGEFEEGDAGIEHGFREAAHIWRGIDPGEAGGIEVLIAGPVLDRDDGEVEVEFVFGIEHVGEFSDRHAVADGDGVMAGEVFFSLVDGSVDGETADGIDAIEDEEGEIVFRGGFHGEAHGRDIGVEAGADILNIEDERIEAGELIGGGFAAVFAVKAVDGEASFGVGFVVDVFIGFAADAVFGAEEGDEVDVGGLVEEVDGGGAGAIAAGVIGDEAEALVFEGGEILGLEGIDAVEGLGGQGRGD